MKKGVAGEKAALPHGRVTRESRKGGETYEDNDM